MKRKETIPCTKNGRKRKLLATQIYGYGTKEPAGNLYPQFGTEGIPPAIVRLSYWLGVTMSPSELVELVGSLQSNPTRS